MFIPTVPEDFYSLVSKIVFLGHIWSPAGLNLECFLIAAAGIFEEKGCVWVVDTTNKLIALDSSLIILEVGS